MNTFFIKRVALDKLDFVIEKELGRLYTISPDKPILEHFILEYDINMFTEDEIRSIRRNIDLLNSISGVGSKESDEGLFFLKMTLLCRPIFYPWKSSDDTNEKQ